MVQGAACERMLRFEDAECAYRLALGAQKATGGVCTSASLALARIYSLWGDCLRTLDQLTAVLLHVDSAHGWSPSDQPVRRNSQQMLATVSTLIAVAGMQSVQAELEDGACQFHPALEALVEAAFEWGTDGCEC